MCACSAYILRYMNGEYEPEPSPAGLAVTANLLRFMPTLDDHVCKVVMYASELEGTCQIMAIDDARGKISPSTVATYII